jgi:hypothetical protein
MMGGLYADRSYCTISKQRGDQTMNAVMQFLKTTAHLAAMMNMKGKKLWIL